MFKSKKPAIQASNDDLIEAGMARQHAIRDAYQIFKFVKPVMLLDIQERRIYAIPYAEFRTDPSLRSQKSLEEQYDSAQSDSQIVVFVRDNEGQRLISFLLDR